MAKGRDLAVLHVGWGIWLCTAWWDIRLKPLEHSVESEGTGPFDKWAIPEAALTLLHDY